MITASHNPVQDNGVKVVEPLGEMLVQEWEDHATHLANASTEGVVQVIGDIVQTGGLDTSQPAKVLLARDNRPSGDHLKNLLKRSVELMGAECSDYGVLTTPQLHYMVRCVNTGGAYGAPTEAGYYRKLSSAFHMLVPEPPAAPSLLKVDAANGVGGTSVKRVMEEVRGDLVTVQLYNNGSGVLNDRCGADYVKGGQIAPNGIEFVVGDRCASFDGDADRIVYFCKNSGGHFQLLDGDRIATLASLFISEQLQALPFDLSLGVVQTAYANGGASLFLEKELGIPVACTSTGVKHLHHRAAMLDIGVYFEANGHGTVLFGDRAQEKLSAATGDTQLSDSARRAAGLLYAMSQLLNQAVGDAVSDMLMVEAILIHKEWRCEDWVGMYHDLPNRQLKVKVKDRVAVKTADSERQCISPAGLQDAIDALVASKSRGRSFVRPSGTEDVVRVYAEAETQALADELAVQVAVEVFEQAGGVGKPPSL